MLHNNRKSFRASYNIVFVKCVYFSLYTYISAVYICLYVNVKFIYSYTFRIYTDSNTHSTSSSYLFSSSIDFLQKFSLFYIYDNISYHETYKFCYRQKESIKRHNSIRFCATDARIKQKPKKNILYHTLAKNKCNIKWHFLHTHVEHKNWFNRFTFG